MFVGIGCVFLPNIHIVNQKCVTLLTADGKEIVKASEVDTLVHLVKLCLAIIQKTDLALSVPVAKGNTESTMLREC